MSKIRVIHHSKYCGYSGTDRVAQLFCKYLKQNDNFEPFLVYRDNDPTNTRLDILRDWLGDDHVVPYHWVPGKRGRQSPYLPEEDNLFEVIEKIDPQIIHVHYSGYNEHPAFRWLCPNAKWIGTNIFGYHENDPQMDLVIYICNYIYNTAIKGGGVNGPILYNPVELPHATNKLYCRNKLIAKFNLPTNAIILGRVGRQDNFDGISLNALKLITDEFPNVFYLVVNPCENWSRVARQLNLNNVKFLPTIINDMELSEFYLGLDIYAHARHDGEINPVNIVEAQSHRLPVISHRSKIHNGQSEIIGDTGFVVPIDDHAAYAEVLSALIQDSTMRKSFGDMAYERFLQNSSAETIVQKLEGLYEKLLD